MSEIQDAVQTIGPAIILIAIVVVALSTVFGLVPELFADQQTFEDEAGFESGTLTEGDDEVAGLEVSVSTETGVQMGANESYVDDPTPNATFTNGSWAVAITAAPADGFNENATYTVYGAANETVLILYEDGNWTARYAEGGQTAFVTGNVTSDDDGGFFGLFEDDEQFGEPLVVEWDAAAGELTLYVDGSEADTAALTSGIVARDAAISWHGTLDELQIINATVGASAASEYAAAPSTPLAPGEAAARMQFDDGRATTVYYADGSATFVGDTAIGSGVADPAFVEGDDYALSTDPVTLTATDDGELADAPIVYVSWSGGPFAGVLAAVQTTGGTALGLLVLGLLALAGRAVIDTFGDGGF